MNEDKLGSGNQRLYSVSIVEVPWVLQQQWQALVVCRVDDVAGAVKERQALGVDAKTESMVVENEAATTEY